MSRGEVGDGLLGCSQFAISRGGDVVHEVRPMLASLLVGVSSPGGVDEVRYTIPGAALQRPCVADLSTGCSLSFWTLSVSCRGSYSSAPADSLLVSLRKLDGFESENVPKSCPCPGLTITSSVHGGDATAVRSSVIIFFWWPKFRNE